MQNRPAFLFLLASLACLSPLTAQRTWVVDAAAAAGSDFKTIAEAVAAAAGGDRIRVRSGSYRAAVIKKSLSLFGDPGAKIQVAAGSPGFQVEDIGLGKSVSIRGFLFSFQLVSPDQLLSVKNCRGRVLFVELVARHSLFEESLGSSIENSAAVTLDNCILPNPLRVRNSRLHANSCELGGIGGANSMELTDSSVTLVQCQIEGNPFSHAITCTRSTLDIRGDSTSTILGGQTVIWGNQKGRATAIVGDEFSHLTRNPLVTVIPGVARGFLTNTKRRYPWLSGGGGQLGKSVDLTLYSRANQNYMVFVGLPGTAQPIPSLGMAWLDLRAFFVVATGTQGASERVTISRPVPKIPAWAGLVLSYQAIGGAVPSLTSPVSMVLFD